MDTSSKPLQYGLSAFGGTKRTNFTNKQFHIVKEEMSKTEFVNRYKSTWFRLKDAIDDGRIALHLKDGRVVINVREALQAIWPGCHIA